MGPATAMSTHPTSKNSGRIKQKYLRLSKLTRSPNLPDIRNTTSKPLWWRSTLKTWSVQRSSTKVSILTKVIPWMGKCLNTWHYRHCPHPANSLNRHFGEHCEACKTCSNMELALTEIVLRYSIWPGPFHPVPRLALLLLWPKRALLNLYPAFRILRAPSLQVR